MQNPYKKEYQDLIPRPAFPQEDIIHKTNANHNRRPISRCDLLLDDKTIGRSYYWGLVTCPECLRFKGGVEKKMAGKGNTAGGMVR